MRASKVEMVVLCTKENTTIASTKPGPFLARTGKHAALAYLELLHRFMFTEYVASSVVKEVRIVIIEAATMITSQVIYVCTAGRFRLAPS